MEKRRGLATRRDVAAQDSGPRKHDTAQGTAHRAEHTTHSTAWRDAARGSHRRRYASQMPPAPTCFRAVPVFLFYLSLAAAAFDYQWTGGREGGWRRSTVGIVYLFNSTKCTAIDKLFYYTYICFWSYKLKM